MNELAKTSGSQLRWYSEKGLFRSLYFVFIFEVQAQNMLQSTPWYFLHTQSLPKPTVKSSFSAVMNDLYKEYQNIIIWRDSVTGTFKWRQILSV